MCQNSCAFFIFTFRSTADFFSGGMVGTNFTFSASLTTAGSCKNSSVKCSSSIFFLSRTLATLYGRLNDALIWEAPDLERLIKIDSISVLETPDNFRYILGIYFMLANDL